MRLAIVSLAAVLLAGCASDVVTSTPGETSSTVVTDPGPGHAVPPPDQLVFQVVTGGGFVPLEYYATGRPSLSVYGDGTAYVIADTGTRAPGRPIELLRAHVTRPHLLDLIERASRSGLFDGTERDLGDPHVTEMPSSEVTFRPGTAPAHSVSAYALQYTEGDDDLTAGQRAGRRELRSIIDAFGDAVVRTGATRYSPQRVDVSELPSTVSSSRPQPWPGPPLAQLLRPGRDRSCGVVTGAAAARVYAAALDTGTLHWREGTGVRTLAIRALLPGEPGCER